MGLLLWVVRVGEVLGNFLRVPVADCWRRYVLLSLCWSGYDFKFLICRRAWLFLDLFVVDFIFRGPLMVYCYWCGGMTICLCIMRFPGWQDSTEISTSGQNQGCKQWKACTIWPRVCPSSDHNVVVTRSFLYHLNSKINPSRSFLQRQICHLSVYQVSLQLRVCLNYLGLAMVRQDSMDVKRTIRFWNHGLSRSTNSNRNFLQRQIYHLRVYLLDCFLIVPWLVIT